MRDSAAIVSEVCMRIFACVCVCISVMVLRTYLQNHFVSGFQLVRRHWAAPATHRLARHTKPHTYANIKHKYMSTPWEARMRAGKQRHDQRHAPDVHVHLDVVSKLGYIRRNIFVILSAAKPHDGRREALIITVAGLEVVVRVARGFVSHGFCCQDSLLRYSGGRRGLARGHGGDCGHEPS